MSDFLSTLAAITNSEPIYDFERIEYKHYESPNEPEPFSFDSILDFCEEINQRIPKETPSHFDLDADDTKEESDCHKHSSTHDETILKQISWQELQVLEAPTGHQAKFKPEREIFLVSKLKKREPRRSFDLGDTRLLKELPFISIQETFSHNFDSQKVASTFLKSLDRGEIHSTDILNLNQDELKTFQKLINFKIKNQNPNHPDFDMDLIFNMDEINGLFRMKTKKRTEELLKKNFKTVIKIMLENFAAKNTEENKEQFLKHYFGNKAREYNKLFKCIQMSQDFYKQIFNFSHFRKDFLRASEMFPAMFRRERFHKTLNLVSVLKTEVIFANKSSTKNLRTPWTVQEGEESHQLMQKML